MYRLLNWQIHTTYVTHTPRKHFQNPRKFPCVSSWLIPAVHNPYPVSFTSQYQWNYAVSLLLYWVSFT